MKEQIDWKEIADFVLYVLVLGVLAFLLVRYVGQRTVVSGASMEAALSDGDNLIVDKLTYRFRAPERFQIIVFPDKQDEEVLYIKRIIGLPGERVRIDGNGIIYINDEKLSESYGKEVIRDAGLAASEIQLGDAEYFVLGDNRNNSMDSRDARIGLVKEDEITGRAWIRIYPFDKIGVIRQER